MSSPNAQEVFVKNHNGIYSNRVVLNKSHPRMSLPSRKVPDNVTVLVKNNPGNTPGILVIVDGESTSDKSYPLVVGQSVGYSVQDTSEIFVGLVSPIPNVDVIVNYTFEVDK